MVPPLLELIQSEYTITRIISIFFPTIFQKARHFSFFSKSPPPSYDVASLCGDSGMIGSNGCTMGSEE